MQPMTHRLTLELRRLRRDSHDRCCVCSKPFHSGNTSHSGYDSSGRPLYVGDCCADMLAETAVRNYYTPLPYERPPADATLWRYKDLAKFIALLKDRALFFARADCLGDPFEGAKGFLRRKSVWDKYYLEFFREAILNPPPGHRCTLTESEVESEAQRLLRELDQGGQYALQTTFLSCWHESEHESEALWRLHGGEQGRAVAVRTSFAALNDALGDDPSIEIGRVGYLDFSKGFAGINEAFFRKRKSFEHEREVRALVRVFENPPEFGLSLPVDLHRLINEVFVSPLAPTWFEDIVREVALRFELDRPVLRSELGEEPFF
jgi:hypothetical protein